MSDAESIDVSGDWIDIAIGSSYEEIDPESYTVTEARALIGRIEAAITLIETRCADGHLWDEGMAFERLTHPHYAPDKLRVYYCERSGCDARYEELIERGKSEVPA